MEYGFVYKITCVESGKSYIGVTTKTLQRRWKKHIQCAMSGSGYLLHKAIRKYGVDSFVISQIATALDQESLFLLEQELIKQEGSLAPGGYNLSKGGEGLLDFSSAARQLRSAAQKGKIRTSEHRRKIGEANRNRIISEETRAKMSLSAKLRQRSPLSFETKQKIRKSQKGKVLSEEHRRKIGETNSKLKIKRDYSTGRKHTESAIKKISLALRGRKKGSGPSLKGWETRRKKQLLLLEK